MSSRRTLPAAAPGYVAVAGWDNPLMTFFAQVSRNGKTVLWLGDAYGAFSTPQAMATRLRPYATLLPEMIAQLQTDRLADIDRAPSPLQRIGRSLFHG
ncbi:MAG: hypothetical protein ACRYHQ_16335 [Janthinobacterium lividum]